MTNTLSTLLNQASAGMNELSMANSNNDSGVEQFTNYSSCGGVNKNKASMNKANVESFDRDASTYYHV